MGGVGILTDPSGGGAHHRHLLQPLVLYRYLKNTLATFKNILDHIFWVETCLGICLSIPHTSHLLCVGGQVDHPVVVDESHQGPYLVYGSLCLVVYCSALQCND